MLEKGYSQMLDKEREQWEVCFWKIKRISWLDKDYNEKFAWERLQWEELARERLHRDVFKGRI